MNTVIKENTKVYIEGVRKVYWDTGEMCEFASCLTSAMLCLGENIPYHFIMGTSGAAFRCTINPGEWDFGNYGIRNISADSDEPIRRALQAAGVSYTLRERGSRQEDWGRIQDSIDRGVPVLASQVVGPSDFSILTGYADDGEVLLGWSTYQNIPDDHNFPPDSTGYFRKPGWHDNLGGYILIGAKINLLPRQAIYLDALKWAVHLLRTPKVGRNSTGLEGLRTWADEMTQEKYFPAGNEETLGHRYVSAAINLTMLRDHCTAEPFLRQAGAELPGLNPEISLAADCYAEVKRIVDRMDGLISDNFSEKAMKAIADPPARRAYAEGILQICQQEDEAAGHMQRLIERYG